MSAKVWMSGVRSNSLLGNKLGLRWKLFGQDWSPAQHVVEVASKEYLAAMNRNAEGHAVERSCLPEALAIWDRKSFDKTGDLFAAYGYWAIKERLAGVLSRFDLGAGSLIPFPLYKEDLDTLEEGSYFLINFGARKSTLLPGQSKGLTPFLIDRVSGEQVWDAGFGAGAEDIALSPRSLTGADLWTEERLYKQLFMSDALLTAIRDAGVQTDLRLSQCRIVGGGGA